jgi:hypothetical protein
VLGILRALRNAAAPLSGTFIHPMANGIRGFVVIVLGIGLLARSATGQIVRRALERTRFEGLRATGSPRPLPETVRLLTEAVAR